MKQMDNESLDTVIVHCSATKPNHNADVDDIRAWHKARGFHDIGYHFIIKRNGVSQRGRSLEYQGAHAKGYNNSIGVCLVGGVNDDGDHEFNFSRDQMMSLNRTITSIKSIYKKEFKIIGHRDVDPYKGCPCFNVQEYFSR